MQDYLILIREWFQNQSHRLVLQNNSWSSQQLIDHTVGNSHQWKKTCISPSKHINNKEPLWAEEKKINTKENIERDQRKVHFAKHKNYCTPILLHAQDVFPVMFLQAKKQESADISSYDFFQASSAVSLKILHNSNRTLCEWHRAGRCWKPEP